MTLSRSSERATLLVVTIALMAGISSFGQVIPFVNPSSDRFEPCAPERLAERMEKVAKHYEVLAPLPRIAFVAVAFPRDEEEAKAMAGYAVALTISISQDKTELPLSRVYMIVGDEVIDLERLASVDSTVPRREKLIARTFGRNRSDALYLLPIHAAMRNGKILVDFTRNRFGFEIHEFEDGGPDGLGAWNGWPDPEARPSPRALEDFIRREFPCFLAK